jgi:TrmH family RNA methyltransferase
VIPVHKLEKLPRHQRLRKIANLLEAEDHRLAAQVLFAAFSARDAYLVEIARVLCGDEGFDPAARSAIAAAFAELSGRYAEGRLFERRPINNLRYIVNEAVGKQTADWDFIDGSGNLSPEKRKVFSGVRIYLEDIRSPYNVGSIFRAAESFGVERVYLSPLCASPDHPRAARSSMGCSQLVPWERAQLENLGGPFLALETGGTALDEFDFPVSGVLIVGSEELGVSPKALALAESSLGKVSIPTIGAKGSLNVSVAFGIAMREWCTRLI